MDDDAHLPQTAPPADVGRRRPWWRRHRLLLLGSAAVLAAVAMAAFQPWKLFVDTVVDEAAPTVAAAGVAAPASSAGSPAGTPTSATAGPGLDRPSPAPASTVPPQPRAVARGTFIAHEHATTGSVVLLELASGERVLRLEGLDTSNGPDLKVWITDAPVIEGTAGWGVFDDGRYIDLGSLKGNKGSQNYPVPADADLDGLTSVSIWCDRFNVSFGAAQLVAV